MDNPLLGIMCNMRENHVIMIRELGGKDYYPTFSSQLRLLGVLLAEQTENPGAFGFEQGYLVYNKGG